jgi:hypothetical protein
MATGHPNDPATDNSAIERIVEELIAGDELIEVTDNLEGNDRALWEVTLLRVLREHPELFADVWPVLQAELQVRAEAQLRKEVAEGQEARWAA